MCECMTCKNIRSFRIRIKGLLPEQREYFENIYDVLLNVEFDNDYYKAILEGKWPGAEEILRAALAKIEKAKEVI